MAGEGGKTLEETPTWAVAVVCAVFILLSYALEKILHKVGTWLRNKDKKALYDALEKIKAELMVLGFISLTLVFCQDYIAEICLPAHVTKTMLPCPPKPKGGNKPFQCKKKNHEQLISVQGLHEIHILIFFLAVIHVVYSVITGVLGRLKLRGWTQWEEETRSNDYEFTYNDPSRFRFTHQITFVRTHTSFWTRIPLFFYIGCFCRQFVRSVSKSDYLTLRHGFIIAVHPAQGSKFNFLEHIKRSLEDDFKTVVGVSPVLWASIVVFLLLNVNGWHMLFWASLIPVIIILAVGTKLQAILTRMALQIADRHEVVLGMPLVKPSNKFFWFGRPHLVLQLIHFALFMNAFQLTYFLWVLYEYKIYSCFKENLGLVIARFCFGVGALPICSYITLPLYALITQMGSSRMKISVTDEEMSKAEEKKKKHGVHEGQSSTPDGGQDNGSIVEEPIHK